jgi:hypothetical protein
VHRTGKSPENIEIALLPAKRREIRGTQSSNSAYDLAPQRDLMAAQIEGEVKLTARIAPGGCVRCPLSSNPPGSTPTCGSSGSICIWASI